MCIGMKINILRTNKGVDSRHLHTCLPAAENRAYLRRGPGAHQLHQEHRAGERLGLGLGLEFEFRRDAESGCMSILIYRETARGGGFRISFDEFR